MTKDEFEELWIVSYNVEADAHEVCQVSTWLKQDLTMYLKKRAHSSLIVDVLQTQEEAEKRMQELEPTPA